MSLKRTTTAALCLVAGLAMADDQHAQHARVIDGYIGTTFTLPPSDNPTVIRVNFEGRGGLSHIGKVRAWTTNEEVNVVTGRLTANVTFEDEQGYELFAWCDAASGFQPDGRVTFEGPLTVLGGTGPYENALGTLLMSGWARSTSPNEGIGFFTVNGTVTDNEIKRWRPWSFDLAGTGATSGLDFVFLGGGKSSTLGPYSLRLANTPGPHNGFVGIINNKFTIVQTDDDWVWTAQNGAKLRAESLSFLYFEIATVGETPTPDFTKPVGSEAYITVVEGTEQFEGLQGVARQTGLIIPASPTTVTGEWLAEGFLSGPHFIQQQEASPYLD